jgi:thiol:disulfide interchange protein DsbC
VAGGFRVFNSVIFIIMIGIFPVTVIGQAGKIDVEHLRQSLTLLLPGVKPERITPTPIPNIFEVVIESRLVYVTGDGRYLFEGEIIDLERQANLTTPRLKEVTLLAIEQVGEKNMLIFEPADKIKHTLTVFTDIDSAYSRKLQQNIAEYTYRGIRIRYLFSPRAGVGSPSYEKAVTVWCANNRHTAMTRAMSGESLESLSCPNPVSDHLQLGRRLGISGAPVLVLENGEMLPGYVDAEKLYGILSKMKSLQKP